MLAQGRKRNVGELNRPALHPVLQPASSSSTRSSHPPRSTSPAKRAILELFHRPVRIKNLSGHVGALPQDVVELYEQLQTSKHNEGTIPHEVKKDVIEREGEHEVRSYFFRSASTPNAETSFERLLDLVEEAEVIDVQGNHESTWNNFVHTPVLKTVFSSRPPKGTTPANKGTATSTSNNATLPQSFEISRNNATGEDDQVSEHSASAEKKIVEAPAQARLVGTMAVGIQRRWMPTLEAAPDALDDLDTRTTTGSTLTGTEVTNKTGADKKVDYVVCLEAPMGTRLHRALKVVASDQPIPYINQSAYVSLQYGPIAVSIETKVTTAPKDALLQLGTWVAAWQERMLYHRRYIAWKWPELIDESENLRMPSTLLIEVISHRWSVYFACDNDTEINLYGPLDIGSTQSLTQIYALVNALEVIKTWIERDFRERIEQWLVYERMDQRLNKGDRF